MRQTPNGYTALTAAAINGHRAVVEWLVAKGADVNAASADGMTALMCAAFDGNPDVIRVLAEKGADVNAKTPDGEVTPLLFAVLANHPAAAGALADKGARCECPDGRRSAGTDPGHPRGSC